MNPKVISVQVNIWTEDASTNYDRHTRRREQRTFTLSDGSVWIWRDGISGNKATWTQADLPPPCAEASC